MEVRNIEIAGNEYPVKLGHYALRKCLAKAGAKKLSELDKVLADPDADNIPHFVLYLVENGLRITETDTKAPKLSDIEYELDKDLMFWANVVQAVAPDVDNPENPDEGN